MANDAPKRVGLASALSPEVHSRMTCNPTTRLWLFLLFTCALVCTGTGSDYDATGRQVSFYPNAMMLATNPKALVFYRETKLISTHLDLPHVPKRESVIINSTCDPELAKFYDRVLASIRGVQRATNRLLSVQGVTDLLECDSYLRRFYAYVTGLQSTLQCQKRHYANHLHDCKQWALRDCRTSSPQESAWLASPHSRKRRSSWFCHAGLAGLARFFYKLAGGHCETNNYAGLLTTLRETAGAMHSAQLMMHVLYEKQFIW